MDIGGFTAACKKNFAVQQSRFRLVKIYLIINRLLIFCFPAACASVVGFTFAAAPLMKGERLRCWTHCGGVAERLKAAVC